MRLLDAKLLDKSGVEIIVVVHSFFPSVMSSPASLRSLLFRMRKL